MYIHKDYSFLLQKSKYELFVYLNKEYEDKSGYLFTEVGFRNVFTVLYNEYLNTDFQDWLKDKKFKQKLWHFLQDDYSQPLCKICGKELKLFKFKCGYSVYCSTKCANNDLEVQKKIKTTKIDKYGSFKNIYKKCIDTCVERYGVTNISQLESVKEKKKETTYKHYSVENPSQSEVVKKKMKNTFLKKYNVENPWQAEEVKEKIKQTCLEKYGTDNPNELDEVKEKIKQTCLEKYGYEYYSQTDDRKYKIFETYKKHVLENNEDIIDVKDDIFICKCTNIGCDKCQNKCFSIQRGLYYARKANSNELCTIINKIGSTSKSFSSGQKELLFYIKEIYNGTVINMDKHLINEKTNRHLELDVYLPDLNLAFEYNGDYYHMNPEVYNSNDYNKTLKMYANQIWNKDLIKKGICDNNNITLVYIWEHDWKTNKESIKQDIFNIIYDKRIDI